MTTDRLLLNTRTTLQQVANELTKEPMLHRAVGAWLMQRSPPEAVLGCLKARPAPRSYEWVAVAALAEAAGWPIDSAVLEDGLDWLSEVALDRMGTPAPVTTDAIAQVALALAVKNRVGLQTWFSTVLDYVPQRREPEWAANGALSILNWDTGGGDAALRVALQAVGASTTRHGDEQELINILKREKPLNDPLRAVVLYCALEWLRLMIKKNLPNSASFNNRATLLEQPALMISPGEPMRHMAPSALVRYRSVPHVGLQRIATNQSEESSMTSHKILFLAANPNQTTRIAVDEEARDIEQKLQAVKHRDVFKFITKWAVRPDDFQDALLREEPTIVHFSGHGSRIRGIVLHGDTETEQKSVSGDALAHLFSVLQGNIRIVVLNACYSEEQAKAISNVIDFVIGMNESIDDKAARVFAFAFYRGLGFGKSVKTAFDLGVSAIKLEGLLNSDDVPVLLIKSGIDPEQVTLL